VKALKLVVYSVLYGLGGLLPALEANEAWVISQAPVRAAVWEWPWEVAFVLVPLLFWVWMLVAAATATTLADKFYATSLGVCLMGGVTVGQRLADRKLPQHPDRLLRRAAREVQVQLEHRFVNEGRYPVAFNYRGRELPDYDPPAQLAVLPGTGGDPAGWHCPEVGTMFYVSNGEAYLLGVCGLDGAWGGRPTLLRKQGKIEALMPDKTLRRALAMEQLKAPAENER
jgi:hypothetical protein